MLRKLFATERGGIYGKKFKSMRQAVLAGLGGLGRIKECKKEEGGIFVSLMVLW